MGTFALLFAVSAAALGCPFCTALEPTLSSRRDAAAVVAPAAKSNPAQPRRCAMPNRRHAKPTEAKPAEQPLRRSACIARSTETICSAARNRSWRRPADRSSQAPWSWSLARKSRARRSATVRRVRYGLPSFRSAKRATPTSPRLPTCGNRPPSGCGILPASSNMPIPRSPATPIKSSPMPRSPTWRRWPAHCRSDKMQRLAAGSERVPPLRARVFTRLALSFEREPRTSAPAGHADRLFHIILSPADDFRAGFDGIIGGYLLVRGASGLDQIEELYLSNPKAADGDVRHALAALRFLHEFSDEIPPERLAKALRHVLARPEFAGAGIARARCRWPTAFSERDRSH